MQRARTSCPRWSPLADCQPAATRRCRRQSTTIQGSTGSRGTELLLVPRRRWASRVDTWPAKPPSVGRNTRSYRPQLPGAADRRAILVIGRSRSATTLRARVEVVTAPTGCADGSRRAGKAWTGRISFDMSGRRTGRHARGVTEAWHPHRPRRRRIAHAGQVTTQQQDASRYDTGDAPILHDRVRPRPPDRRTGSPSFPVSLRLTPAGQNILKSPSRARGSVRNIAAVRDDLRGSRRTRNGRENCADRWAARPAAATSGMVAGPAPRAFRGAAAGSAPARDPARPAGTSTPADRSRRASEPGGVDDVGDGCCRALTDAIRTEGVNRLRARGQIGGRVQGRVPRTRACTGGSARPPPRPPRPAGPVGGRTTIAAAATPRRSVSSATSRYGATAHRPPVE